ncbi:hypothetical protein RHSIM_Rhsim07G0026200 [Rhododendron simsii]|uniref:Peptidase M48 domain-containing protein n=1 Tax=Rhododendron simsii TaxID=118357 RepID=A0A834GLQ9_RHOSS|nr:hypothetical protein RHSIM_Rhsim07G0026200 [Rhododendron simsii]
MAFSYSRSKLPRNGNTPSTLQTCSIFHYPNLKRAAQLRALSATRHCLYTDSNDFSIAKQHCARTSSLGQLVGSLAIMNLNWGAEWWNSVTRRMSPARYRHCPEYVVLMSSYSTWSLGGESREKGGALGIQKIVRGSELKNSLLLALHKVKLQVFQVLPFGPGGSDDPGPHLSVWKQLLQDPITLRRCCFFRPLFFTQLKRIPYSKRYHLLPAPSMGFDSLERDSGDATVKELKEKYKGSIVPPNSPQTIRVESILEEIVQAMHSGLRLPNRGKQRTRFDTEHLDGMKRKVMVVDTKDVDADGMFSLPNGTIVVSTRYLERFQSDAGLAAVLGHEVGHGVARHCLEHFTTCLFVVAILQPLIFIPYLETPLGLVFSFISRRREIEADYIGLMLMASGGYDPQLMSQLYETSPDLPATRGIFASHPSVRKRVKKLKEPKVMEQAAAIYKEVTSGLGVRSFI